jgi:hypothetical protein
MQHRFETLGRVTLGPNIAAGDDQEFSRLWDEFDQCAIGRRTETTHRGWTEPGFAGLREAVEDQNCRTPARHEYVWNMSGNEEPRRLRDRVQLEYSMRGGQIYVTYPPSYTGGFPIGEYPAWYETDPPNDITRERVAIWRELRNQP